MKAIHVAVLREAIVDDNLGQVCIKYSMENKHDKDLKREKRGRVTDDIYLLNMAFICFHVFYIARLDCRGVVMMNAKL